MANGFVQGGRCGVQDSRSVGIGHAPSTSHRLYTLAHDPVYRLAMSWQNGAYNQPPHLGFWLGAGVDLSLIHISEPTRPY